MGEVSLWSKVLTIIYCYIQVREKESCFVYMRIVVIWNCKDSLIILYSPQHSRVKIAAICNLLSLLAQIITQSLWRRCFLFIFPASEMMLARQGKWVSPFFNVWFCSQPEINTLSRKLFQVLTTTSEAKGTNKYMQHLTKCVLAHDKILFFFARKREREVWSVFWIRSYASLTQCWPDHRHCVACIIACLWSRPATNYCMFDFPHLAFLQLNPWTLSGWIYSGIEQLRSEKSTSNVIMARNNM